ncbi:MAG: YihY/virulence factor BrkB family protein [Bacteroidetes bacterium]|nr:MAG: YihY/virulence factor BrkB family protein [Bacteroidota bacterium]
MKLKTILSKKKTVDFLGLLWKTIRKFIRDDAMSLSAALAYYTAFALPAILIILISLVGYFWGEKEIEEQLLSEFTKLMGENGANQVKFMLDKVTSDSSSTTTLVGVMMLLFSSTVVFYTIQHSMNRLWKISDEIRHGFIKYVLDKVISLGFILAFGFLLTVSLGLQAFIAWMDNYFGDFAAAKAQVAVTDSSLLDKALAYLSDIYITYFSSGFFLIEFLVVMTLNTILFACIFKFLPDAKVKWKIAIPGGILTALLFKIGQSVIGWKLGHTDFTDSFGPAGAIIIVFVWIFYTSCILFYGGIFVDLYGKMIGEPVKAIPGEHHHH